MPAKGRTPKDKAEAIKQVIDSQSPSVEGTPSAETDRGEEAFLEQIKQAEKQEKGYLEQKRQLELQVANQEHADGIRERKRQHDQLVQLDTLRQIEFGALRRLVKNWLFCVVGIILLHGFFSHEAYFLCWKHDPVFKLSDPVLIALMTTTTAAVIGLFAIAAKWLFASAPLGSPEKPKKPKAAGKEDA